jgi:Zn finger protein HypA/HybF involved in hydrogenase expression
MKKETPEEFALRVMRESKFDVDIENHSKQLERDIKLDIISGKYKCISAYEIPKDVDKWLNCPNCHLKPLVIQQRSFYWMWLW